MTVKQIRQKKFKTQYICSLFRQYHLCSDFKYYVTTIFIWTSDFQYYSVSILPILETHLLHENVSNVQSFKICKPR